jgi:hypothetical protein
MNLQPTVSDYTVKERANTIYKTVVDTFDWDRSSDCVTPLELAQKQLEGLNPSGTICIPGAGIGTYVVAAINQGFRPENITAVELDEKYFEFGSPMFSRFGVKYVLADYLTWDPQMQFDVVVGNPPYQGGDFGNRRRTIALEQWCGLCSAPCASPCCALLFQFFGYQRTFDVSTLAYCC